MRKTFGLKSMSLLMEALAFSLLVACAHQATPKEELADSALTESEDQLNSMAETGTTDSLLSTESTADSSQSVTTQSPEVFANSAVPSTDDLVAQMTEEPTVASISGKVAQGQSEMPAETKPLMIAKAMKVKPTKMESVMVPNDPAAVPAKKDDRQPGSANFPEKATIIPVGPDNGAEAPAIMEPNDDQLKSEVEKEKTLASPEVGGVIMRPWFPWVAISIGCIGFMILGVARLKRRRATNVE
ncbi:MAG: hypothetical protein HYR96_12070 [Deltaproteobacteria bacterium]|nr:hypothetical protein [Deltaproteobacteria bacterium]MBI3293774.1 hypothetical protein [Deltaproteobacteria bacterium]